MRVRRKGCEELCRGCAHRDKGAEESAAQKDAWVREQLAPWADTVAPIRVVSEPQRWDYRDKVCLHTEWSDCAWRFGLLNREELIAIPECPVHTDCVRSVVELLQRRLPPGDRFPLAFYLQSGAQATLVLKTDQAPGNGWLDQDFQMELIQTGLDGLWLNLHTAAGDRVTHPRGWRLVWGQERSTDERGLVYGPASFQQVLAGIHAEALDAAEGFLAPDSSSAVLDLYCGSGSTLCRWREAGAACVGIELGSEALDCARVNAPGAATLQGRCADRIPQIQAWAESRTATTRLLYANPPRTGLEPEVLDWVVKAYQPARIAYLSCSPGTQRRDLERLTAAGWSVAGITPYDFHPQTLHVESLALLSRS